MQTKKILTSLIVITLAISTAVQAAKKEEGVVTSQVTVDTSVPAPSESELQRNSIYESLAAGDEEKAIQKLKEVVTSSKKFDDIKEWATLELWRIARAKGSVPAVVADLEKVAAKDAQNIALKKAICEGYVRLQDWSKVVEIYEGLAKRDPQDAAVARRLLDYNILAKKFDKARQILEPIVEANPGDIQHSDMLLNTYIQAGIQDKAISLFQKRLETEPNSPGLRGRYAQALQNFGLLDEARQQWQKARELDSKNLLFQQRIAEIYAQQQDYANARQEYQKLLDAAPDNQPWFKSKAEGGLEALKDK